MVETPNAQVGVKFSQPDVEVSYDPAMQETVALARTVALLAKNLLTKEEMIVPVGSTVIIITTTTIKIIAGLVSIGKTGAEAAKAEAAETATTAGAAITAGTAAGTGTGTMIAIGAGAAVALGGGITLAVGGSGGDESLAPTATPVPEPTCGGVEVGGYCWYLGADHQSCTEVCASYGGYHEATRFYAGSDGTDSNCAAVLFALQALLIGWDAVVTANPFALEGLGCYAAGYSEIVRWFRALRPTDANAVPISYPYWLWRACACNS